jgi:cytochrome c1
MCFSGSHELADPLHNAVLVGPAARLAPELELLGEIGRGLSGERRIAGADPLAAGSVAQGAGRQAAGRVPLVVQHVAFRHLTSRRRERHSRVVGGHHKPFRPAELPGDPGHLRVMAPPVDVGFHLPNHIAYVAAGQPRSAGTVAAPVETVAGEAGVVRTRPRSAQRDEVAVRGEALDRGRCRIATRQQGGRGGNGKGAGGHVYSSTDRPAFRFRWLFACCALAACKPPPEQDHFVGAADPQAGLAAIERAGCGSCHTIPGLYWPKGQAGPDLHGLDRRTLIAGQLPNRPDVLAAFVRNAPALVSQTGMPAMPVSEAEARDIAAYLYQQDAS